MKDAARKHRDAFGRLLVPIPLLSWNDRLAEMPKLIARCLAGNMTPAEQRWIGRGFQAWRQRGIALDQALSLVPPAGCTLTVHVHYQRFERDRALVQFAAQIGSDSEALRVLRGEAPCPAKAMAAYEALREHCPVPSGPNAVFRARLRLRQSFASSG